MGDGNGWVTDCACGTRPSGRLGAAGLPATDGPRVLPPPPAASTPQGAPPGLPAGCRGLPAHPGPGATREAG